MQMLDESGEKAATHITYGLECVAALGAILS